jgi:P27 family predicted phage terminase small subunit
MSFEAIEGDRDLPEQPNWRLLFSVVDECAAAAKHWTVIVAAMRVADTISRANGASIKRLVLAQIVYDRAALAVMREGAIRRVKSVDRKNPNFMVMRQASEMCSALEAELGLSPAKRNRVGKVARPARQRTAADTYLRPVK